MNCESVRELLPDHTLGTLSDLQDADVRRHLRGCASCRAEATALDEGMSLFASAVHAAEPPSELQGRVMEVLSEEWAESERPTRRPVRWLAMAAAVVIVVGSVAWAGASQIRQSQLASQAESYQAFLHALGGRDVRVATIQPRSSSSMEGSAVLYDSDRGQSWVLVLLRAPGTTGTANVTLIGTTGNIALRPVELAEDGDGSTWLVTSADISTIRSVRVTDASGNVLGFGTAAPADD
ncbi:MAG TPA: zf-HC2 domain-containing protein [Actinomycetota bacterium]|nr:zf-HC2 domain-containing protein [Actinomycetota bacterium]